MSSHRHVHPMLWGIGRRLALVALVVAPLWLAVYAVTEV
jgi:hypothetical protein